MKSINETARAMTAEERAAARRRLAKSIPADQSLLAAINRADRREQRQKAKAKAA